MREIRFALGYMPHRLWGNILQAQLLAGDPGKEFLSPQEYVQNDESTYAYQRLTPMQKEVVGLIDQYNDRQLHRLFSKKATVKEFQDSVDPETIQGHIRPYIEKLLYRILEIARDNRIPVFVKDKSNRNVFDEDFLVIERNPAIPQFRFTYEQGLSYALHLDHREAKLDLRGGYAEIISNSPAVILLENRVFFVEEIEAIKMKPFLKKEQVSIPGNVEEKYFKSFVRNTLRDYDTTISGFEVRDTIPDKRAELVFESGINNRPVWILSFRYNDHEIFYDGPLRRFVNYTGIGKIHAFERFSRDESWELTIIDAIKEFGLRSRDEKNFHLDGEDLYAAISFVNQTCGLLHEAGVLLRHRLQKDYYLGPVDLTVDSREKEDWFDVKAEVNFGEHRVPFLKLRDHILHGVREYELPGGGIAILPEEWFFRFRSMFEFGRAEGSRIRIHKQHFSMMDGSVREFHEETLSRLEKLNETEAIPSVKVPSGLEADLRPYQKEGYTWLCFLQQHGFGGCLADDMGLGKTLQAIALLLRSREQGAGDRTGSKPATTEVAGSTEGSGQLSLFGTAKIKSTSLVVVPASLLHNWISECRRFAPELKILSHVGIQRNRELSNFNYYDLVVSTYHTVRQDIESLCKFRFHYVILDESQMIKNPSSRLYQAMVELQSEHRIVLTGTPIENSLSDLWAQISFVNPGLLGSLSFFKRSFVQPIEKKKDQQREEKLRELISPFILRRTKQEVASELPPVFDQVRYCSMTEDQRRTYEEEKSLARNSILENLEEAGLERSSIMVLQALTRLRQIANHPALIEEYAGTGSGKFAEVCRDVESVISEGHKVLMFSSFVKHLELFRAHFDGEGIRYSVLTGSLSQQQRKKAVEAFQRKKSCPLFLISLKAGGVGLNLTAADYVFILDPWWNPAAELQALNRAHRIGQEKNVFVYRFISGNTIEEKILRLQQRKMELAETFVSSNNPLRDLSEKEILALFS